MFGTGNTKKQYIDYGEQEIKNLFIGNKGGGASLTTTLREQL